MKNNNCIGYSMPHSFNSKISRKLLLLLLFLSSFTLLANSHLYKTSVTLDFEQVEILKVFERIEALTDFKFLYDSTKIDELKLVSIRANNEPLSEVLNKLFKSTSINYLVKQKQIVLKVQKTAVLPPNKTISEFFEGEKFEQHLVSGTIKDDKGQPLPGASVVEKGSTNGVTTDFDGNFSIQISDENGFLLISYIGFAPKEVPINGQFNHNIILEETAAGLDEVVVVGYGAQKKVNLTGAISQVKVDEIVKNRPINNLSKALQGMVPGLRILSNSGLPGSTESINIRGITSINGGSPLVLVDNVPMDINDINPADVESVSVLKDASSSSIYGGRAAFGVVLITTKKGLKNQPIRFNYQSNSTFTRPAEYPKLITSSEYVKMLQDFGNTNYFSGQDLATWGNLLSEYKNNPDKYPEGETRVNGVIYRLAEVDWFDMIMTNGFEQMHNFSFSGGSDKSEYRVSARYLDEDGVIMTNKDRFQKANLNAHLSTELSSKLTSTLNILYNNEDRSKSAGYVNSFGGRFSLGSDVNTGYYTYPDGSSLPWLTPNNIIQIEPVVHDISESLRLFERLEYNPVKNLKITGEYTYQTDNSNNESANTSNRYMVYGYSPEPINTQSYFMRSNSNTVYSALNIYATYQKKYKSHNFTLLSGFNSEQSKYSSSWAKKLDLLTTETLSLSTSSGDMTNDDSIAEFSSLGYFSRLNYSYNNKYLLEGNMRFDGSSKFPKSSRYGFFPSFSAGWIVTEEPFFKSLTNIVNFLKIRASWGDIGNQAINDYAFIPFMNTRDAMWIDPNSGISALTISPPSLVSSSFTWEKVRSKDIGIDLKLINNKLGVNFDYFIRETIGMLAPGSELPSILGTSAPFQNVADLESKGWEIGINWNDKIGDDFEYSLGINLSDNRGFITKYKNDGGLLSQYYEGYEIGEIWGYVTDGYYTVNDFESGTLDNNLLNGELKDGISKFHSVINPNPGDIKFMDLDGNGEINPGLSTLSNPGDRKIIGNSNRRYLFGIIGNLQYKNFNFSLLIDGVGKRDLWIDDGTFWAYKSMWQFGTYKHQLDYWTPENTQSYYPRSYQNSSGNTSVSRNSQTKYLQNGSYMRLKNIEVGYNIPKTVIDKLPFDNIKLFMSMENLLTIDHLADGLDPELSSVAQGRGYPFPTKISLGLNASF